MSQIRTTRKYSILSQFIFVLFLFTNTVKSDLPVHCLLNDVEGKWDFTISENTFDPDLANGDQTSCGHGLPNKVVEVPRSHKNNIPNSRKISLDLKKNFAVMENGAIVGSWSMIYDQSLLIRYKSAVLTAPFKYYKHRGSEDADSDCWKTFLGWYIPRELDLGRDWACFYGEKAGGEISKKEFTGFLEVKEQNMGDYLENNIAKELKKAQDDAMRTTETGFSFIQTGVTNKALIEKNLKYEQMGKVVAKINNLNLGWEADIHEKYIGMSLLQVKHELGLNKGNYNKKNKSDNFSFIQMTSSGISDKEITANTVNDYLLSVEKEIDDIQNSSKTVLLQTEEKLSGKTNENSKQKSSSKLRSKENQKAEEINNGKDTTCANCVPKIDMDVTNPTKTVAVKPDAERETDSENVTNYAETSKYINADIDQIDETKLPKNWDWRNVGGKSYLPPVRNQGHCGSCYVFSTMACLETRLRIQTNLEDKTLFSKQYPLSCNFYSEGCDGGYPVLVSKFSKEFELVPEDCYDYTQETGSCSNVCKDFKSNSKKYSVGEYGYMGGSYGKTSEAEMMKELRARGPIPGNMLVHWSFQYYKRGIFSQQKLKMNTSVINTKDLYDYGLSWAKVEHSITLVGYGEEEGHKYWIGMNTWGEEWGDNGFFKILRGENEASIETMGDYMNVKVESRKK